MTDPVNEEFIEGPALGDTLRGRLFWSFGAQSVAILLRIVQQIVLVPVLIWGWGIALYSDWLIVFSATSFLSVLDLGMQIYFGNALLIAWSTQNYAAYRRFFAIAMGLYATVLLSAAAILIASTFVFSWPSLLGARVLSTDQVLWTASLLAAASFLLIPFGIVTAIYRAHGDYGAGIAMSVIVEALRGFGIIAVVLLGGTPVMAAGAYLAIAIIFIFAVLFDLKRRYGELPLGIAFPSRKEVRTTVSHSALYLAPTIVTPLMLNSPVLLLGFFGAAPSAIVIFTASRTLTGFLRQVVLQFSHPVGAEMSRQYATRAFVKLRRIFFGAGRMVSGLAGVLGGFTIIAAAPFIAIWTHGAVAYDGPVIAIFVATIILTAPAQVALMVYVYNNRPRILVIALAAQAGMTAILCFLFIKGFSAIGAAAGTGLAECLSVGLLMPYAATRDMGARLSSYLLLCYSVAAAAFTASFVIAWALQQALQATGLVGLALLGSLWAAVMALPSYFLILAREEQVWLRKSARARIRRLTKWESSNRRK